MENYKKNGHLIGVYNSPNMIKFRRPTKSSIYLILNGPYPVSTHIRIQVIFGRLEKLVQIIYFYTIKVVVYFFIRVSRKNFLKRRGSLLYDPTPPFCESSSCRRRRMMPNLGKKKSLYHIKTDLKLLLMFYWIKSKYLTRPLLRDFMGVNKVFSEYFVDDTQSTDPCFVFCTNYSRGDNIYYDRLENTTKVLVPSRVL